MSPSSSPSLLELGRLANLNMNLCMNSCVLPKIIEGPATPKISKLAKNQNLRRRRWIIRFVTSPVQETTQIAYVENLRTLVDRMVQVSIKVVDEDKQVIAALPFAYFILLVV
jgi:hypothetical protein